MAGLLTLTSVDLPSVDLSAGSAAFAFTVGASDDGAGVGSVEIWFDKSFMQVNPNGEWIKINHIALDGWSDSFDDGSSSTSVTLSPFNDPGTYSVTEVIVYDILGNMRTYTAAELAAIPGVETSFTVTGSTPDTAAPSLVSIDLPSVDLSAGDAPFTFTVGALDSGMGVEAVEIHLDKPVMEINWNGDPIASHSLYFNDWDDSFSDGTSSSSVNLSSFTAPGTYSIGQVTIWDKAGNYCTYTAAELAAIPGVETSFTITGSTPDTTAPSLVSVDLPSAIDLSAGDATVSFTVEALDTGVGVKSVEIRLEEPIVEIDWEGIPTLTDSIYFYGGGINSASLRLSSFTAPGTYSITGVTVRDKAGNEHTYTAAELAVHPGVDTSFTVAGGKPDTTAPSLVSVDLPSAIDLSAGNATTSFTVGALDTGAGVSSVVILLNDPVMEIGWDGTPKLTNSIYFSGGESSQAVTLSSFTAPGTYSIDSVVVRDNVGNKHTYTAAELAAIPGVETSFTVTGGTPDTAAPSLVSLDLPSAVDLSAGDASVSFTAGAQDSGVGVMLVEIQLNKTVVVTSNGKPTATDTLYIFDWDDSFSDGTSSASLDLSSFTGPGTYSITNLMVRDHAGNEHTYTAAELAAIPGVETSFTVTGSTPDTSKPNLVSLTLPSSVDVTNGAASFSWSAKALDTGAGVEWVSIKFDKPISQVYSGTLEDESDYIVVHDFEDSFDDGQSSATVHLSSKNQPGTYSILEVVVHDRAGNDHVYTPSQIASLGGPTSLTLVGAKPTPPVPPTVPTTVTTSTDLVLPEGVLNLMALGKANLKLTGNALDNRISGNAGKNIIDGGAGDDILDGRLGNDTLTGGRDKDSFLFGTKLGTSKTDRKMNFDTIKDFIVRDDQILLDNAIFKKLGRKGSEDSPAALSKKFFVVGSKAKDKDDYLVYNNKTGVLAYDADGSGKGAAVEFAQLKKGLALTYKDFFVI